MNQAISNLFPGFAQDALESLSGDLHLLGTTLLLQSLKVFQTEGL